jgi:hypothetical protein
VVHRGRNTGHKNHGHPHFLANYLSDTEQTSAGLPRGRLAPLEVGESVEVFHASVGGFVAHAGVPAVEAFHDANYTAS